MLVAAEAAAQVYADSAYSLAEGTSDDTVTLPATTTVTVVCGKFGTPTVGVTGWSVSALRVGAAHLTGFTPA